EPSDLLDRSWGSSFVAAGLQRQSRSRQPPQRRSVASYECSTRTKLSQAVLLVALLRATRGRRCSCVEAGGPADGTCCSASSIPPGRASWQQGVRSSWDNVASSERRLARHVSRWLRLPASRWSGARIGWTGQPR